MTIHIDKVKPFLGEVPKSWLADEPSSDIEEPSERADNEQTLVKEPINEPNSEQLISEPKQWRRSWGVRGVKGPRTFLSGGSRIRL